VTHQLPACCSSAVVPLLERRNHDAVVVANAEAWIACTLVLAYDAEELPCSVQEENCTCLLWSGCQTHVAQQVPGAMLRSDVPHSLLELQSVTKRSQNASQCALRQLRNHADAEPLDVGGPGLESLLRSLHTRHADQKWFSKSHANVI